MAIKVKRLGKATDQYIITDGLVEYFQSYDSIVAKRERVIVGVEDDKIITLDINYWNYSNNTIKYRNMFLNETTKETKSKIKSGEYVLVNLN